MNFLLSTILYHEQYKTGRATLNTHKCSLTFTDAKTISIPLVEVYIGKAIQIRISQRYEEISQHKKDICMQ